MDRGSVYFDLKREPIALLRCPCQPGEGFFAVSQSHISHKIMPRRNIVAKRGFLLQSLQLFLRESADSRFESRCDVLYWAEYYDSDPLLRGREAKQSLMTSSPDGERSEANDRVGLTWRCNQLRKLFECFRFLSLGLMYLTQR